MAMGMMPVMHPRIRSGEIAAPGPFAFAHPPLTAVGSLMAHLMYGVLVGGPDGALV